MMEDTLMLQYKQSPKPKMVRKKDQILEVDSGDDGFRINFISYLNSLE